MRKEVCFYCRKSFIFAQGCPCPEAKLNDLIEKALDFLPKTPAAIAEFFRGELYPLSTVTDDPIAKYITELAKKLDIPDFKIISGYTRIDAKFNRWAKVNTPPHVNLFMRLFDEGEFPFLVDRAKTNWNRLGTEYIRVPSRGALFDTQEDRIKKDLKAIKEARKNART